MQVSIYSREEIEAQLQEGLSDRAAVISFYDKGTEPVDLSGIPNEVFQVTMEDSELNEPDEFADEPFISDTEKLVDFIFAARNAGLEIICQCENGEGRSAGCAAAIRQFFNGDGIEVFTSGHYFPNLPIYHKVYNSLMDDWKYRTTGMMNTILPALPAFSTNSPPERFLSVDGRAILIYHLNEV